MKLVTAFEHGWLLIGDHGDLTQQEADALNQIEYNLPSGCLEWGRNRLKFKQFCGVIQVQQQFQIEILPKVFPHQSSEQQRTTLINMLCMAGEIEGLSLQQAGLATSSHRLLDVFIQHFLKLLDVQMRQGLLRDYRDIEDTLDQVRGKIDLIRQQRENLFKPQRMACLFNELMDDIPINRLLHTALICIPQLTTSASLRQQVNSMRMRFSNVGTIKKSENIPRSEDLNRMQYRYAAVIELARMFITSEYLDIRSGQQPVFSLLFDMNQLFERFVAIKLRPVARQAGLTLIEQGPRRYLGEDSEGKGRLLMRPDISLIDTHKRLVAILDTKWKMLGANNPLSSLSSADLYQLSTYASAYRCDQVMLLYPEQDGLKGEFHMTLDLDKKVLLRVMAVPLNEGNFVNLPVIKESRINLAR